MCTGKQCRSSANSLAGGQSDLKGPMGMPKPNWMALSIM